MTSETSKIPVSKQKGILRGCANGRFLYEERRGKEAVSKVYLGQTPLFIFWGGEESQGFYHADAQTHTHTHTHTLSLDQGQEWRRSKMQQITTTLPTPKFQTS